MENAIIIIVLVLILGGVGFYIYKAKKNGAACIGCPHAKACGGGCCCPKPQANPEDENASKKENK